LLVAACLNRSSQFTDLAMAERQFAVNVLDTEQEPVARWFANLDRPAGEAQFDRVQWRPDPESGAPLIAGSLARFSCSLIDLIAAGDHHILLAEVTAGATTEEGSPLLHFAGRLHDGALHGLTRGSASSTPAALAVGARPTRS
jgi:flavin reductase